VFDRIGQFSPMFPRSQDTELMLRLWRSGARALYVPAMVVHAAVQPERLTKRYHREWHSNIGRCNARMGLAELTAADGGLRPSIPAFPRMMGVPLFMVRQLVGEGLHWLVETARGRESRAFWRETRARALLGYMQESAARHRRGEHAPADLAEPAAPTSEVSAATGSRL
jgi:hypothetical protein